MDIRPRPTKAQLDFMDMELGIFFHFGVRTFNEENRDWDMEPMTPASFNPSALDCRSWIEQIARCGAKYAVFTAKHHDGFANWPSAYTEFSVKNSPWKNGEGDVVREFIEACREFGVKAGIYYSCAQFDTAALGSAYDDLVVGQLEELLASYGDIDILWFDACGSQDHNFDIDRIVHTIRSLAPDVLVFGGWSQDIRWIGNEWGIAATPNRNTVGSGDEVRFFPGECDCCITRCENENFWFYNKTHEHCLRTPEELFGMYLYSVGRGANLLLNIAPDRRGLLPEKAVELLASMTAEAQKRFVERRLEASEPIHSNKDGRSEYSIRLTELSLVDTVILEEDLTDGEHIEAFTLYTTPYRTDDGIAVFKGTTVGHKRICTFPPIRAEHIDVVIDAAVGEEKLKGISACYAASDRQIVR